AGPELLHLERPQETGERRHLEVPASGQRRAGLRLHPARIPVSAGSLHAGPPDDVHGLVLRILDRRRTLGGVGQAASRRPGGHLQRSGYYLIHAAKLPLALLEASDSPVADLFRLERSAAWDEMIAEVSRVRQHVGPEEESLRHAFEALLEGVVLPRLGMTTDEIPARMSLEEVETMLAERIDEWNRKLAEENLQKGRKEGLNEGLNKGLNKGLRKGRNEGRREGEALSLVRLLEKKFGLLPKEIQKRI